jgi:hypothetical protein
LTKSFFEKQEQNIHLSKRNGVDAIERIFLIAHVAGNEIKHRPYRAEVLWKL